MSGFDTLLAEPIAAPDLLATRRAQFTQANASQALEGMEMSADDLTIQERVARGELTHDQAVAHYINVAHKGV